MSRIDELTEQWRANLGREPTLNDEDVLVDYVWERLNQDERHDLARKEIACEIEEELRRQGCIVINGMIYKKDGKLIEFPKKGEGA